MDRPRVQVALATWNGAAFLDQQLASVAAQRIAAHVVVGDDGSTDSTIDRLRHWQSRMPGGMTLLPAAAQRLGAKRNFARVLAACDAEWIACCDQDDVWDATHVELLLHHGEQRQQQLGAHTPLALASDLRVVDAHGRLQHRSFRHMQRFSAHRNADLRTLLVMNCFPGCAMLVNQALLRTALPLPDAAVMHDWWLALVASALGELIVRDETLGEYRVHGGNVMGAQRFDGFERLRAWLRGSTQVRDQVQHAARQAHALHQRYRDRLSPQAQRIVQFAARLESANWLHRRRMLLCGPLRRYPWSRQLNFILRG